MERDQQVSLVFIAGKVLKLLKASTTVPCVVKKKESSVTYLENWEIINFL